VNSDSFRIEKEKCEAANGRITDKIKRTTNDVQNITQKNHSTAQDELQHKFRNAAKGLQFLL
jgi:hypothetical protein